jgi:hypothetical protein
MNTRECLAMLLRSGNVGLNAFTDHEEVLAAAIRQVPARLRRKVLIRVDGAAPATTSSATCCSGAGWSVQVPARRESDSTRSASRPVNH